MSNKKISCLSFIEEEIEKMYDIIDLVGEGTFGTIYKVQEK